MDDRIDKLLENIEETYRDKIQRGASHYMEVNLGKQAHRLGFADLAEKYKNAHAIIPLKLPQKGMKVRIDGRDRGLTPLPEIRLLEGLHEVEIFSALDWWRRDPDEVLATIIARGATAC